jgi:hypothetical protein
VLQQTDSRAPGRGVPDDRDADETSQSQQEKFPVTDVFQYVELADGRLWMQPEGVELFAGDLSPEEKRVVLATDFPPAADLFGRDAPGVAWKMKPSWYIVASEDRTVQPDLERFVAQRMNATTYEVKSTRWLEHDRRRRPVPGELRVGSLELGVPERRPHDRQQLEPPHRPRRQRAVPRRRCGDMGFTR